MALVPRTVTSFDADNLIPLDATLIQCCRRSQCVSNGSEETRKGAATCRAHTLPLGMFQQISQQSIGGDVAIGRVAGNTIQNDRLEAPWNLTTHVSRPNRLRLHDQPNEFISISMIKNGTLQAKFVQRGAQRVDIARGTLLPHQTFRSHVS